MRWLAVGLISLLILPTNALAAISVETGNIATKNSAGSVSSATYSVTTNSSATWLLVVVSSGGTYSGTTVTYNGTSMTNCAFGSIYDKYDQVWGLKNPTSGAHNVVVTLGASGQVFSVAVPFDGTSVASNCPLGSNISHSGSASSGTVTGTLLTTTANSLLVNAAYIDFANNDTSTTANGETLAAQIGDATNGNFSINVSYLSTPSITTYTSGWTRSGTNSDWEQILIEVLPASGGGGASFAPWQFFPF